ncbi:single-stranded DNA-binding protein [Flaviflexus huanghaiensis]|uniref:single-stranded DNA-binding protein n=1 Tax=Flaviflexus huanghaiensis TaxID=1111473 RepID=UPI0015FB9C0F|nr:single-stranded DNA-binding protein [Flaviflexus huanghaiensis]
MTIRTKESLAGFVATDPELTFTSNGDARVYMRVGQPQARFKQDGTFTQLDPEFTDLVMFRRSAELAHEQFRKGDNFIAEGETRTYTGDDGAEREQFIASRIGHDNNITRYTVDRGAPERETPRQEAPGREQVQQVLAQREADLDPEPPAASGASSVKREAVAR